MPIVTSQGAALTNAAPGKAPKQAKTQQAVSPLPYKANFVFLAHPLRWDVFVTDKGPEILPALTELEFQPGLAGVLPVRGESDGDPSYAIQAKRNKGWIDVPPDFAVTAFGEARDGYVHCYDSKSGPDSHHCCVWVRPYSVAGNLYHEEDRAGFHQFLRDVRDQVMPALDANVRRGLKAKLEQMLKTAQAAATKSPGAASTVDDIRHKLTVFDGGAGVGSVTSRGKAPRAAPKASSPAGDDDV
jgi:uncharacterized membrane protein